MRFFKALSLIPIAFGSLLSVLAKEYNFEEFNFDQVENNQNKYEPKDKLDEYNIKAATYSIKFASLMNDGAEGSEYTDLMFSDGKRILADAGYDFVISTANSSDLFTPTLVDPDRLIFYGKLTTPFTTKAGNAGGEVEYSFTLENSYVMNAACTEITGSGKAKYGLSVLEI